VGFRAFAEPAGDTATACERAGLAAEQAAGLPSGILLAIGRVESGRWDSARGRVTAWPWTINAAGKGHWFDSEESAARTVNALIQSGTKSIDTGCFQINLLWHPGAFDSLEQAFDPDANARYAAAFLLSLYSRTGSWESAVETYHSADPTLGFAYRQQVYATWLAATPVTLPVRIAAVSMPAVFEGVSVWTPLPPGSASGVVAMPRSPGMASAAPGPLPAVTYRALSGTR